MTTDHPVELLAAMLDITNLAHGFFIAPCERLRSLGLKDDICDIVWVETIPKPTVIDRGVLKDPHDSYRFMEKRVFRTASAFGVFLQKGEIPKKIGEVGTFMKTEIEGWPGLLEMMQKMDIKSADNADPQTDRILYQKGAILAQKMRPTVECVFFLSSDREGEEGKRRYSGEVYERVREDEDCSWDELSFELYDRLIDTNEAGSHQWVEYQWRDSGGPALGFVRHGKGGWQQIFGPNDRAEDLAALMAKKGQPQI